jgi:hypothetical protein
MGKFKRKSKKSKLKINRKVMIYDRSNGFLNGVPVFETDEEIEYYLMLLRKQHDREAEYIANNLGLIY